MLIYEKVDKVMTKSQLMADGRAKFCDEIRMDENGSLEAAHVVYDVRYNWFDTCNEFFNEILLELPGKLSCEMYEHRRIIMYTEMKRVIDKLFVQDQHDYMMELLEALNKDSRYSDFHDFQKEMRLRLYGKKGEEENEIIWSWECKFRLHVFNEQLYVEKLSKQKADRERACIDSERNLFWRRVVSKEMLNLLKQDDLQGYPALKEFFTQAAWQLQRLTLREDDFHENPIHYMLGLAYDPNEVSRRVGTKLVEAVKEFGFSIRTDRMYQAQEKLEEVFQLEPESEKITDDNVRALTVKYLEKIHENLELLNRVFEAVDGALKAYFMGKRISS